MVSAKLLSSPTVCGDASIANELKLERAKRLMPKGGDALLGDCCCAN
jgi:hypothetical protein